jgi:hypothetical protein
MRGMRSIAATCCLAGLLLGAGPADGAVVAQLRGQPQQPPAVTGPRLAGDRVVWSEVRPNQPVGISAADITGGAPQRLDTVAVPALSPPPRDGILQAASVLASPRTLVYDVGAIAVDRAKYGDARVLFNRLVAGPLEGPYAPLGDVCPIDPFDIAAAPMALDGTRLVSASPCRGTISVRDLSDTSQPGQGVVVHPADGHSIIDVRTAGDLVAYSTTRGVPGAPSPGVFYDQINVIDLRDGVDRVAWRSADNATLLTWDLRDDGALALAQAPMNPGRVGGLTWMDPSGATHDLGVDVERTPLRFVGDRIAALLSSDGKAPRTVALVGLDGGVQSIARLLGEDDLEDQARLVGLDFDGRHLAWAAQQCETVTVEVVDPATSGFQPPPGGACLTPILTSQRASVDRDGRFQVTVDCLPGCHGTLTATNQRHRTSPDRMVVTRTQFRLGPGAGARGVALRLNAYGRRLMRTSPTLAVRVRLTPRADTQQATPASMQTVVSLHR